MATPFIKWAGGKKYLLPQIEKLLGDCSKLDYHEPMVGGGAVLFRFGKFFKSQAISDVNSELINCYQVIKTDVDGLISELGKDIYKFKSKTDETSKCNYLAMRASNPETKIKEAARTIFLLKTCFNGLMRKNKAGRFNVPMGSYTDPVICNEENLKEVSEFLQNVSIYNEDACSYLKRVGPDSLVFLDPPYDSESQKTKFTGYSGAFTIDDQVRLIETLKLSKAKFIYTNRSTKLIKEAFGTDYKMLEIPLKHSIQPKYTTGVVEQELIVYNL